MQTVITPEQLEVRKDEMGISTELLDASTESSEVNGWLRASVNVMLGVDGLYR